MHLLHALRGMEARSPCKLDKHSIGLAATPLPHGSLSHPPTLEFIILSLRYLRFAPSQSKIDIFLLEDRRFLSLALPLHTDLGF